MEAKKHPQGRNEVEELSSCKKSGGAKKDILKSICNELSFLGGTRFFQEINLPFWLEWRV